MQAQPQGRKRGAKENIDAGVKKPKKEEGEEEPKPYVCAIYRRDIASFLPRAKIQQWRLTSSRSNASLSEFPSELPRFNYQGLRVIFERADQCHVASNGFAWVASEFKEFKSIYKFRFCCRDVRDRASELVGQRLFPNKPDGEGVTFKLKLYENQIVCGVALEKAIRDVRCKYISEDIGWPARCPREAATQATERDDGTVEHRFDYTNAHSKKPFSLLLETRHHEGRTRISKFHLTFGSA